jgi:pimeloyl-ACP methyl ester carboxylesterase
MTGFLLLHGGQHAAWCWDGVRTVLEGRGHRVAAPDLPGGDGRPVSLDEVEAVAGAALRALGEPAVVVAHSMGGMAAVLVADRHRPLVRGLLFATAVVPRPGVPVLRDTFGRTGSVLMGALGRPRPIRPVASYLFGHRLAVAQRRDLLARLRPEDMSRAGVPFPAYDLSGLRCAYLLTTRDRLLRPRIQARFAARLSDATVIRVEGGHSVTLEHAGAVADAAEALAAVVR